MTAGLRLGWVDFGDGVSPRAAGVQLADAADLRDAALLVQTHGQGRSQDVEEGGDSEGNR